MQADRQAGQRRLVGERKAVEEVGSVEGEIGIGGLQARRERQTVAAAAHILGEVVAQEQR